MRTHHGRSLTLVLMVALAGCARAPEGTDTTTSPTALSEPTASPTIQDIMELPNFAPLEPGTYFIDPDLDPSTPLRVVYEVPVEGWSMWIGAAKFADDGHVGVSITTAVVFEVMLNRRRHLILEGHHHVIVARVTQTFPDR